MEKKQAPRAEPFAASRRRFVDLGSGFGYKGAAAEQRRDGRAAEGGGLLNRYAVNIRIGGSNPPPSANSLPRNTFLSPCWRMPACG